jgi:tetratricopeptide (TPR) repeat protein
MKRVSIIILLMFFFHTGFACLNGETKLLKNGTYLYEDREGKVPHGHRLIDKEEAKTALHSLDSLYEKTLNLAYLSDKGLVLIFLKQYQEALDIYLRIEKLQPNRYSTASNIGTAYELVGDNKNALKWIKKAISINSKSHENSEWIHVKILEAKINGDKFINTQHLLNTDFGNDSIPVIKLTKAALSNLSAALYYQLNERMTFIKPKERIVAQLLFDIGNMAYLQGRYEDAEEDYLLAKEYGYSGNIIEKRLASNKKMLKSEAKIDDENVKDSVSSQQMHQTTSLDRYKFSWPIVTGVILMMAITILILKLKNKN